LPPGFGRRGEKPAVDNKRKVLIFLSVKTGKKHCASGIYRRSRYNLFLHDPRAGDKTIHLLAAGDHGTRSCVLGAALAALLASFGLAGLPESSHGASKLLLQILLCMHDRPSKVMGRVS
jgi:hypothetical protein